MPYKFAQHETIYQPYKITKDAVDDEIEDEPGEPPEDEPDEPPEEWYILCCGYICEDTISTCNGGCIQMGTCPWLCLDNSYVCCRENCGSCGICGGAFAITDGCFDSCNSCLLSNCACSCGGGMYLSSSCATFAGCNIFCGNQACCGKSLYANGTGNRICIYSGGCVLDYDGAYSNYCMNCCTNNRLPDWCNCTARSVLDISVV